MVEIKTYHSLTNFKDEIKDYNFKDFLIYHTIVSLLNQENYVNKNNLELLSSFFKKKPNPKTLNLSFDEFVTLDYPLYIDRDEKNQILLPFQENLSNNEKNAYLFMKPIKPDLYQIIYDNITLSRKTLDDHLLSLNIVFEKK